MSTTLRASQSPRYIASIWSRGSVVRRRRRRSRPCPCRPPTTPRGWRGCHARGKARLALGACHAASRNRRGGADARPLDARRGAAGRRESGRAMDRGARAPSEQLEQLVVGAAHALERIAQGVDHVVVACRPAPAARRPWSADRPCRRSGSAHRSYAGNRGGPRCRASAGTATPSSTRAAALARRLDAETPCPRKCAIISGRELSAVMGQGAGPTPPPRRSRTAPPCRRSRSRCGRPRGRCRAAGRISHAAHQHGRVVGENPQSAPR